MDRKRGSKPIHTWNHNDQPLVWVRIFLGREGELLGRMLEGSTAGKIVFFVPGIREGTARPGELMKVSLHAEFERAYSGSQVQLLTEPSESGYRAYIGYSPSFPAADIPQAEEMFKRHLANLRATRAAREAERMKQIAARDRAAQDKRDRVEAQYGITGLALYRMLEGHDWAYQQSDDGGVWRRGEDQREKIEQKMRELGQEKARAIWDIYGPGKMYHFPIEIFG